MRTSAILGWLVIAGALISAGCRTNETPEQQVRDAEITATVKSKLAADLGPSTVTNISVNVTNDVATLSGTVHNSTEKSKAIAVAEAVPRVTRVNDNLQIAAAAVQP
jgi:osmotically-inducible protein OsmY